MSRNDSQFDVVVVGGGTAGVIAATASGRAGARTLLLEASGHLGGNAAVGMTFGGFHDLAGRQVVRGIPEELVQRGAQLGGGRGHVSLDSEDIWISSKASVDPETVKYVAAELVSDANVDVWLRSVLFDVDVTGGRVTTLKTYGKSGVVEVKADVYIDATGDGDLAARSGAEFERGGGDKQQLISTMFRVGNVDIPRLEEYMNTVINVDGKDEWRVGHSFLRGSHSYWVPWKLDEEVSHFPPHFGVYYHGNEGDIVINAVGVAADGLDVASLSWAELELRRQSTEIFWWLRDNCPGFATAYLTQVYPIGVRESRRIIGEHQVKLEDMMSGVRYPDTVAMGAYPPDLHDATSGDTFISKEDNRAYELPYRAIIPKGIDGVLLAGRCMSATFDAESGLRGIGPSMAVGEAAGTAAAMSALEKVQPRDLPTDSLRRTLAANGAYIGDDFDH